jgi:hypothetical protein
MNARRLPTLLLAALVLVMLACTLAPSGAAAEGLADDGGAEWQVEQPLPPPPGEAGVEPAKTPVSLGHIGDIQFYEPSPGVFQPNRGALITSGNGGSVKPGVWFYDGSSWRELATQCGATDGRIAWAGPDEFWTVSDGRAGGALGSSTERPPLADNTLCHFAPGAEGSLEIVASYAAPAFQGNSYQAMHAAACATQSPHECWFAGEPLPAPQVGAFMLHWNGATIEPQPYLPEGHEIWDMRAYEGRLLDSMRVLPTDQVERELLRPPVLRELKPTSTPEESPFESVTGLPLYSEKEFSTALDYLHLSVAGESIWAAAGPQLPKPADSREAGVTIIRKAGSTGEWERVIAPQPKEVTAQEEAKGEETERETPPPGAKAFPEAVVDGIAAEPGTTSAWVALDSVADAESPRAQTRASLARVGSDGTVSDRLELPSVEDPHGPLGAAQHIVCPAEHDCWASTANGWLLHLATKAEREVKNQLSDPVFAKIEAEEPITFRPHDEGIPQELSDELPPNNSGEAVVTRTEQVIHGKEREAAKIQVPLLSHVRSKLIHGSTLELTFHLAVKARIQLIARRHGRVVAKTSVRTLLHGTRSIELKLDPKHWPEHLQLKTHPLAPLPTETSSSPNVSTISTSFVDPARLLSAGLIF